ncbi:hypothetical protein DFH06DRAFT_1242366 [Mycena polygramma]|nr:hypothetical protein DFH06DRAFT_1242366 [Mycena polygramma]
MLSAGEVNTTPVYRQYFCGASKAVAESRIPTRRHAMVVHGAVYGVVQGRSTSWSTAWSIPPTIPRITSGPSPGPSAGPRDRSMDHSSSYSDAHHSSPPSHNTSPEFCLLIWLRWHPPPILLPPCPFSFIPTHCRFLSTIPSSGRAVFAASRRLFPCPSTLSLPATSRADSSIHSPPSISIHPRPPHILPYTVQVRLSTLTPSSSSSPLLPSLLLLSSFLHLPSLFLYH